VDKSKVARFSLARGVYATTPCLKKSNHFYYLNCSAKQWPILIIFGRNIVKKLDVNDCSFAHITLELLLHYIVKFRSSSLTVYNNDFHNGWRMPIICNEVLNFMYCNSMPFILTPPPPDRFVLFHFVSHLRTP